ncbi:MAG: two-component system response regulator MprA [actinobacterium acAMD-5]|jgi:two-component system response regulator MprA|nr:MAG: two-component system response regulator MprA [actinobacterium acAMD-5]
MTVLVVDDDRAIREAVVRAIKFDGMEAEAVATAREALQRVNGEHGTRPDLLILDLGLPDLDGLDVVKQIRARGDDIPVLVLTARTQISDRVAGLDAGADDYLPKPFALPELLARVRALLRRIQLDAAVDTDVLPDGEVYKIEDLVVDPTAYRATRNGRHCNLTRTEFALLEVLARNAGKVVPRDMLLEKVWGWISPTLSNGLDVYIGYLRRKLEENGEPRLVQTVRGVGYVLRIEE